MKQRHEIKDGILKKHNALNDSTKGLGKNLQKHQIEVMVLSKVDPIDSAFPAGVNASEPNLVNSFSQAANSHAGATKQVVQAGTAPAVYHQAMINKKNPFKYLNSKARSSNEKGLV